MHYVIRDKLYNSIITMLNILPIEEKKKNLTEYRLRLGVVVIFAVAVLVFTNSVLLIPSYYLATTKNDFVSSELAKLEAKQLGVDQEKDIRAQINEVNKKIGMFLPDGKVEVISPAEMISKIISLKNRTVRIQSISYDVTTERLRVVVLGTADDRDSLEQFVKILKKEPSFTKVDLPIGSYVKSINIDFSVVLEQVMAVQATKK